MVTLGVYPFISGKTGSIAWNWRIWDLLLEGEFVFWRKPIETVMCESSEGAFPQVAVVRDQIVSMYSG
jgi:hypothetical protein